jgi:hypothetical protein
LTYVFKLSTGLLEQLMLKLLLAFLLCLSSLCSDDFFDNGFISTGSESSYSEEQSSAPANNDGAQSLALDASYFQDPASLSYTDLSTSIAAEAEQFFRALVVFSDLDSKGELERDASYVNAIVTMEFLGFDLKNLISAVGTEASTEIENTVSAIEELLSSIKEGELPDSEKINSAIDCFNEIADWMGLYQIAKEPDVLVNAVQKEQWEISWQQLENSLNKLYEQTYMSAAPNRNVSDEVKIPDSQKTAFLNSFNSFKNISESLLASLSPSDPLVTRYRETTSKIESSINQNQLPEGETLAEMDDLSAAISQRTRKQPQIEEVLDENGEKTEAIADLHMLMFPVPEPPELPSLKDINVRSAKGIKAGTLPDGTYFAGQLDESGKPDGIASFSYPDGSHYEGEVKSGVYQGSGRLTMPNGALIEGMFDEGEPSGVISVSQPDGSWMRGEYYGGAINGVGQIHKKDGYYYLGDMLDNQPHGDGYLEYPNGVAVVGKFRNGKPSGLVLYRSDEKDFYLANIEEGQSEPDALIKIDSGPLKDQAESNFGNSFFGFGNSSTGKIKLYYKSYLCEYEGATFDGKAQGHGEMRCNTAPYSSSSSNSYLTYEGEFSNNTPHGYGVRTWHYQGEITSYSEGNFVQGALVYGRLWDHGTIYQGGFSGLLEKKSGIGTQEVEDFAKEDSRGGSSWYEGDLYDGLPNGKGIVQDKHSENSFEGFFNQIGYGKYIGGVTTVIGPMRGHYGGSNNWWVRLAGYVRFSYSDGREPKGLWCYSTPGNLRDCYEDPQDAYKFAANLGSAAHDLDQFERIRIQHAQDRSNAEMMIEMSLGAAEASIEFGKSLIDWKNIVAGIAVRGGIRIVVAGGVKLLAAAGVAVTSSAVGSVVAVIGVGYGAYVIYKTLSEIEDVDLTSKDATKDLAKITTTSILQAASFILPSRVPKIGAASGLKKITGALALKGTNLLNKLKISSGSYSSNFLPKTSVFSNRGMVRAKIPKFKYSKFQTSALITSSKLTPSLRNRLSAAGKALDPSDKLGKLTKAGRAAEKHGSRPDSFVPPQVGSPMQKNLSGQEIVDNIIYDPTTILIKRHHARFGDVIEIRNSSGEGVRFSDVGEFLGLIEP